MSPQLRKQEPRDPHIYDSVRITNDAPISFTWKWDSQKWIIPPATAAGPGETIVPFNAMKVWLGDPESMDVGREKYRSAEARRVRTKHGVNAYNEHNKCEPGEVPNPWRKHEGTGAVVGEVWNTATGIPPLKAYNPQTGALLPCPAYDPEGDLLSTETLVLSENATLQEQVSFLQKQMANLLAQMDDSDDDEIEDNTPVPVNMQIARPRRPRSGPSEAEMEQVGAQLMPAAAQMADNINVPTDRAR